MHTEKLNAEGKLPLMESFYTLQGEGMFQGAASYFIRLAGCDVGCRWCDVKESWNAEGFPKFTPEQIAAETTAVPAQIAVVTGGEPLIYNLNGLTTALHRAGMRTHLETSGAYPMSGNWDWVCFSPKKFKAPLAEMYELADELKIIIFNKSDFVWAESFAAQVRPDCRLFLQPEWSRRDEMSALIVDYIMQNPHWRVSVQTHKYLNIP